MASCSENRCFWPTPDVLFRPRDTVFERSRPLKLADLRGRSQSFRDQFSGQGAPQVLGTLVRYAFGVSGWHQIRSPVQRPPVSDQIDDGPQLTETRQLCTKASRPSPDTPRPEVSWTPGMGRSGGGTQIFSKLCIGLAWDHTLAQIVNFGHNQDLPLHISRVAAPASEHVTRNELF